MIVDKIVRQIHKYKTRLAKRFKKQEAFHPEALATPVEEETIEVVKRKHFVVRPMDVEEAILQMNLIGHDFFMFFNAETEVMNVVYRRHDGFYGLIEPDEEDIVEEAQVEETSDELVLDLDSTIEIEE